MATTTLSTAISNVVKRVATQINAVDEKIGSLSSLTTTANASVVAAVNELKSAISAVETTVASSTNIDDDNSSSATTYSSTKINALLEAAKTAVQEAILGGAGEDYDTLKELADLIEANSDLISALQALKVVKYDEQSLTSDQQAQARTNISVYSKDETDSAISTATADMLTATTAAATYATLTSVATNTSAISTLSTKVTALEAIDHDSFALESDLEELEDLIGFGDDTDFVSDFENALNG